jgi:hypothetical protein
MAITMVQTCGSHFQLQCHFQFVLVNSFGKKEFVIEKYNLQLERLLSTIFVVKLEL